MYVHMKGSYETGKPTSLHFNLSNFSPKNPPEGYTLDVARGLLVDLERRAFIEIDEPRQEDDGSKVLMDIFCDLEQEGSLDRVLSFMKRAFDLSFIEFMDQEQADILQSFEMNRGRQARESHNGQDDDLPF